MSKHPTLSEATMRKAIKARDTTFDGQFVYAVITSGVYCRPSCPARPARPENLRFYADSDAATKAGFRACKRCKPDNPLHDIERMAELARFIEANADKKLTLKTLAERQGLSPTYLQRSFKSVFGVSPKAYQDAARLKTLKSLLKTGDGVSGAMFEAGYGSASRGYEKTARSIGMTPKAYRAGGVGEDISYACRETVLGFIMMAATKKGICFVMIDDNPDALFSQLRAEFPNATLSETKPSSEELLNTWMSALDIHLSKGGPLPETPLDLRGTAFQIKVWQFLLTIPEGDVASYTDVAEGIDKPAAVRAAASACGKNKIALLIPCHRVLRGDGRIGGYRWGIERKRALLDTERQRKAKAS